MSVDARTNDERPIGSLFAEMSEQSQKLIRQELELARVEMSHKLSHVGRDVAIMVVGAIGLYTALLVLLATAVLAFSEAIDPPWVAALIVGVVTLLISLLVILWGRSDLKKRSLKPEQTIASLKEDKEWAKAQISRT